MDFAKVVRSSFEAASDESIFVSSLAVADRQFVNEGELLAVIEMGKATADIKCPKSGFVIWNVKPGDEVPSDHVLCCLGPTLSSADQLWTEIQSQKKIESNEAGNEPARQPTISSSIYSYQSAVGVPFRIRHTSRSKRKENRILSWGGREAIPSKVIVSVPTVGHNQLQNILPDVASHVSAHVIHATSQLLRQFPMLNACCLGEQLRIYDAVHIGFALDAGSGLKVVVLRDTDRKSIEEIRGERLRFIDAYLNNILTPSEMEGATFTISDLSGTGITSFDPIIGEGQAGILGIGGEVPNGIGQSTFQLVLSFDHRLIEGRSAAKFLNLLKEQVVSFERSILGSSENGIHDEFRCAKCGITAVAAEGRNHFLVSIARAGNQQSHVCTICLHGR